MFDGEYVLAQGMGHENQCRSKNKKSDQEVGTLASKSWHLNRSYTEVRSHLYFL